MKCVLAFWLIVCFASQVLSSSMDDVVNRQACIRDADVNESLVNRAYEGDISEARELKCYFKCYFENAGYMNSRGEIDVDKLKANIPSGVSRKMAIRAIDSCKGHDGADGCETAFETQKCLLNKNVAY